MIYWFYLYLIKTLKYDSSKLIYRYNKDVYLNVKFMNELFLFLKLIIKIIFFIFILCLIEKKNISLNMIIWSTAKIISKLNKNL